MACGSGWHVEQNDTGYMGCGSGCEVNRTTQGTWHVGQGVRRTELPRVHGMWVRVWGEQNYPGYMACGSGWQEWSKLCKGCEYEGQTCFNRRVLCPCWLLVILLAWRRNTLQTTHRMDSSAHAGSPFLSLLAWSVCTRYLRVHAVMVNSVVVKGANLELFGMDVPALQIRSIP